jgi:hypothetical protein
MQPLEMKPEFERTLDKFRHEKRATMLYEMPADLGQQALDRPLLRVLNAAGLPSVVYNQCRWFGRELCKTLRTCMGRELAFQLELLARKWVGYGLSSALVQDIIIAICDSFAPGAFAEPSSAEEVRHAT